MADDEGLFAALEGRSATLFVVAAGLLVVVSGLFAAEVATGQDYEAYLGAVAPAGFALAFLGLLGRHRALAARVPRLARGAAVVLGLGVAGSVLLVVGHLGQLAGLYAAQPAWVDAANVPLFLAVLLGFGAYGAGSLLTGAHSRGVSLLMLWPAVVFGGGVILVATFVLGLTLPHWVHVGHSASEAVVFGAIAHRLGAAGDPTPGAAASTDSTASP